MKKFGLLSILIFSVCLLAGCEKIVSNEEGINNEGVQIHNEVDENVEKVNGYEGLLSLYQKEGKVTCEMGAEDPDLGMITSTLYVDGENSYQVSTITSEGEEMKIYTLTTDGKIYSRGDLYAIMGDNIGFVVDAEGTMEEQIATNYSTDEDDNIEINCSAGVKGVSFDVPSDINFMGEEDFLG